jgi:hypothetical protein
LGNTSNENIERDMRKNTAGQFVCFQAVSTTDGSAVTSGSPTVYYTIEAGTQGTGTATPVHEGNGQWSFAPTQAETNGDHIAYTFVLSGAVSQTVNVYPVSFDPTDSVRLGITALPNAAADAAGGLATSAGGATGIDDLATAAALTTVDTEVGQIKTRVETALPNASPGDTDGLHILGENTAGAEYLGVVVFDGGIEGDISGTIEGSVTGNVGGIAGAVNTFDELYLAQSSQHTATQNAVSTVDGKVDTLLTRITSTLFSGITSMAEWLGLLAGKQVGDSTARTEIRATGAGSGTFDETDHSLEAIRERGDIGWTTGAGGSAPTEAEMYTYFTSASRENAFKATGFSTFDPTIDTVALGKILSTAITESNTGDVAESFSFFFNVDPITTKTVNDVGVSGTGLTEQNVRDAMKLAPTAGPAATGSIDSDLELLQTATDAVKSKTDQFRFTVANQVDANALTGGGGDDAATIYTYFTSSSRQDTFKATGFSTHNAADVYTYFTSSNRQNTFRATGYSTHSAADVYAAFGDGSNLSAAASDVTTDLISFLMSTAFRAYRITDVKNSIAACQLALLGSTNIDTVNSQTEFVINAGSADDDAYNDCIAVIVDASTSTQKSVRVITDYVGASKTVTIASAPDFTIEEGDDVVILPAVPSSGGNVTVGGLTQAALAQFATDDTGETTAADGSVAKIAQGQAGGNVTVGSMTKAALAQFATDDTEETTVADGSVAKLSRGSGGGSFVLPIIGHVPQRNRGDTITIFTGESITIAVLVKDEAGVEVDLTGIALTFLAINRSDTLQFSAVATGTATGFSFVCPAIANQSKGWRWFLRADSSGEVLVNGPMEIVWAPEKP